MATLRRKNRGTYLARWYRADGSRVEKATGERDPRRAQCIADQWEAEDRFREDHEAGLWEAYAAMNFSPRFLWQSFTHASGMPFARFLELLDQAEIRFSPRSQWRDRAVNPSKRGRRYPFQGKHLTVAELIEESRSILKPATVSYRLRNGWPVEEALTKPPLSKADCGKRGAEKTNRKP